MTTFPHTQIVRDLDWTNFHATIAHEKVAEELRPTLGAGDPSTAYGTALKAILKDSFDRDIPIRTVGAGWSLSNIIAPGQRILDPSDLDRIRFVPDAYAAGSFAAHLTATKSRAVIVEGGTHVFRLNQELGEKGYAIRTSGAADGHRIAGLIATATHGSALRVGALHETVKALHLVIAPDKAVLLQPARNDVKAQTLDAPFTRDLAAFLESDTGISTELVSDDTLFDAALVSLGSFGLVYSVVLDVAPLYCFDGSVSAYGRDDGRVKKAIETLDPRVLGLPPHPYHFAMVVLPYASDGDGAFVTSLTASPAGDTPYLAARPKTSLVASNCGDIVTHLVGALESHWTDGMIRDVINGRARGSYVPTTITRAFPSHVFGPTRLPPGNGTSTEICVDHAHAFQALEVVQETLRSEATRGHHLLAAVSVRFAPATRATLGMNIHPMNCYLEMPSGTTKYTHALFESVWKALEDAGIVHAYHWGQLHQITPARVDAYYGSRAKRWREARETLLDPKARKIFASAILKDAGLD